MAQRGDEQVAPRRLVLLEGLILLLAAPLLLIPEALPVATAVALLALAFVWLVALFFSPPPATPFNVAFIVWGLTLIVGILATADPAETLPKATGLILGFAVWRYAVIAITTRRRLGWAVALFLLLGLGFSLIGLIGLESLPKIPLLVELNPLAARPVTIPGGLTIHPNQLAGLLCLYLPLLVSLLVTPPSGLASRGLRVAVGGATVAAALILLLTQSRGGWIGLAAGLFSLLVMWALTLPASNTRRSLRGAVAILLLVGLLATVLIGPARLRDLWLNPPQDTAVGTLTTLYYRRELWPWAATAIADFPFTGVGLGAFRQVVFRLYPPAIPTDRDVAHAHNIFLQTALDVGLPGLIAYLAILFVAAAVGWRVARRDSGLRPVSLGLLAGLVAVHVFGLADALALGAKPAVVFWFALGLLAAMSKRELLQRP